MILLIDDYSKVVYKEKQLTILRMELMDNYLNMINEIDNSEEYIESYAFLSNGHMYYFYFDVRNQIENTKKDEK